MTPTEEFAALYAALRPFWWAYERWIEYEMARAANPKLADKVPGDWLEKVPGDWLDVSDYQQAHKVYGMVRQQEGWEL